MRIETGALLAALLAGCCEKPWDAYPMDSQPDRQCRTGGESGYDVYIWECVGEERVAISKWTANASCEEPEKDTAPCGELTAIELELGEEVAEGCESPPDSLLWP